MASFVEYAKETIESMLGVFRSGKDAYEGASRFGRLRLWAFGIFAVDVLAIFLFVGLSGGRPLDLEVWFQPGFPSNMIVFRNEGTEPLRNVELQLDGRYRLEVSNLPTGLRGFELNRDFRDETDSPPPDAYRPLVVHVKTPSESAKIEVESRTSP